MKGRHIVLGLALLVSAGLAAFGDKEPEGEIVESVERASPAPAAVPVQPAVQAADGGTQVMRLIPRGELIGQDGDGDGSVFGTHSWNPPPPEPPPPGPAQEPPPPTAPPIPFTFIGKALGDGRWEVYVAQGEQVQVVRTGDTVAGAWRIDAVAPPVMTVTYLPLGQQQQMDIGANE
jgi:hypothetical protein